MVDHHKRVQVEESELAKRRSSSLKKAARRKVDKNVVARSKVLKAKVRQEKRESKSCEGSCWPGVRVPAWES